MPASEQYASETGEHRSKEQAVPKDIKRSITLDAQHLLINIGDGGKPNKPNTLAQANSNPKSMQSKLARIVQTRKPCPRKQPRKPMKKQSKLASICQKRKPRHPTPNTKQAKLASIAQQSKPCPPKRTETKTICNRCCQTQSFCQGLNFRKCLGFPMGLCTCPK